MRKKTYTGLRDQQGVLQVYDTNSNLLNPRLDLWNHSPTGFECGYGGSGPAQLALAILADYTGDDELAVELHQEFKWKVIAPIPNDRHSWILTEDEIRTWIEQNRK